MEPDWKAAYNILMDYWDYIPEEERKLVDQKLSIALNEQKSPSKETSHKMHSPPKDCIKNVLKRLRDTMDYGIPNKKG